MSTEQLADESQGSAELQTETRYSWIFRNADNSSWTLMLYRWISKRDTLDTTDHWLHHYKQAKPVEVVTEFRMDGDRREVVSEKWTLI